MSDALRIAVRRLWQQPGFSLVAIATLALGLGANITIFTLLHTLLLRSLPVERPHELYRLGDNDNCCNNSGLQGDFSLFSYPLFRHLEREIPGFSELAGFQANTQPISVRRSGDRAATSYPSQYVTGNYFSMFGVVPAAGRLLRPDDDRPDAAPVVVMSHRIWMRDFGGDRSIVGAAFVVNGRPMTLAGVTAEGFFGDTVRPDPTALWIPIGQEPALRGPASVLERPGQHWMYAIGRAHSAADATAISTAATTALQTWLGAQPFTTDQDRPNLPRQRVPVVPAGGGVEIMRIAFSQSLTVLLITSGLVLLIACANLANLLLARADRGQAAIRAALGASAQRLMRQSLIEGIVLSLAGGVIALLLATAGTRALVGLAFPGAGYVPVDATPSAAVLAFGLALALVTGAIFSAAPAWAMARTQPLDALNGVGRSGHERSFIPRRSLVVAQVALSLILLTGAGLLGRSLGNLEGQTLGFEPDARLVVRIELPPLAGQIDRLSALYDRLVARLTSIPGVTNASYALYTPMEGNNYQMQISIDGRPAEPGQPDSSPWNRVGPRYFATLGTKVRQGRVIDERDTPASARVAVVNDAFVRRYFEHQNPLGRRLGLGDASHAADFEIVGVVEDVKYTAANRPVRPMIFFPTLQTVTWDNAAMTGIQARSTLARAVVVQGGRGATNFEGEIRRAMADVDQDITVIRTMPLIDQVRANFRLDRLMSRLLTAYGALALALASLGLYGVTVYGVTRRTREIGIRMALGADRSRIVKTLLRGPLVQTAIGVAIGLPLALLATRAIADRLYGLDAQDPIVLGVAIVVLLVSAIVAAVVPALRAASVDPTQALR